MARRVEMRCKIGENPGYTPGLHTKNNDIGLSQCLSIIDGGIEAAGTQLLQYIGTQVGNGDARRIHLSRFQQPLQKSRTNVSGSDNGNFFHSKQYINEDYKPTQSFWCTPNKPDFSQLESL